MNTCEISKINNYYTASEVAEILGLDKHTILYRCKKGWYSTAIKTEPSTGNPHGQWLIDKCEIDAPHTVREVCTLTRQINPLELQQVISAAITQAVTNAIEPLNQKIEAQTALIYEQAEIIRQLQNETTKKIQDGIDKARELDRKFLAEKTMENYDAIEKMAFELNKLQPPSVTRKNFWARLFGR